MSFDTIETLGKSTVQHGSANKRVYLMKLHPSDYRTMPERLEALAAEHSYTKIFTKIPAEAADYFSKLGYQQEALIPCYYRGSEDALFLSRFTDPARSRVSEEEKALIKKNITLAEEKAGDKVNNILSGGYEMRRLTGQDADRLARLYKTVFPSYPFPIYDPSYLIETMKSHIHYFGIFEGEALLAASSSETDPASLSVEITDFATLPEQRGKGFALHLLAEMERDMLREGITCHYTIARAFSAGMNITFAKAGYTFSGTLINNTDIFGRIESMNVWYKHLFASDG